MCSLGPQTPEQRQSLHRSGLSDRPAPEHTSGHLLMAWRHPCRGFPWGKHRVSWRRLTFKPKTSETLRPGLQPVGRLLLQTPSVTSPSPPPPPWHPRAALPAPPLLVPRFLYTSRDSPAALTPSVTLACPSAPPHPHLPCPVPCPGQCSPPGPQAQNRDAIGRPLAVHQESLCAHATLCHLVASIQLGSIVRW